MQAQRVAVVGGGIAGLGAAWRLARRGYAVAVLERERELGGRAASERVESLWLDRGGRRVMIWAPASARP